MGNYRKFKDVIHWHIGYILADALPVNLTIRLNCYRFLLSIEFLCFSFFEYFPETASTYFHSPASLARTAKLADNQTR